MIWFPHPTIQENANTLVKDDLIRQTDMATEWFLRGHPPEWDDYRDTLVHIAMQYLTKLETKYGRNDGKYLAHKLTRHLKGSGTLPPWYYEPELNKNQQGFLKFMGLCRVYAWYHHRTPDPKITAEQIVAETKDIELPSGVVTDYSQFEVEPTHVLMRFVDERSGTPEDAA